MTIDELKAEEARLWEEWKKAEEIARPHQMAWHRARLKLEQELTYEKFLERKASEQKTASAPIPK